MQKTSLEKKVQKRNADEQQGQKKKKIGASGANTIALYLASWLDDVQW